MFVATVVVSVLLAVMCLFSGVATITGVPAVVDNITSVGWPAERLWVLGVLKILGAVGLLVGLAVPGIGIAAAIGLVLYFLGGLVAHLRIGDKQIAPALLFLALSVAALVLRATT